MVSAFHMERDDYIKRTRRILKDKSNSYSYLTNLTIKGIILPQSGKKTVLIDSAVLTISIELVNYK